MAIKIQQLTVIFLIDALQPSRIVLLKRGSDRKFAPNMYTGIGGKFEVGETAAQCAARELLEEASITPPLTQFGKLVINGGKIILHYFVGLYVADRVPDCNEGVLEWVDVTDVFGKEIIPTTGHFMKVWQARHWSLSPFIVKIERNPYDDIWAMPTHQEVIEGLMP